MKNKYFVEYKLNIAYEINTYKHVGRDYGDRKTANLGWYFNCKRFARRIINKREKKYKICNTYTEWKAHVIDAIPKDRYIYDDMVHWLYKQKRYAENYLDAIKAILIPLYIAIIGIKEFFESTDSEKFEKIPHNQKIGLFIFAIFFIIFLSTKILWSAQEKVQFFEDFICIAEEERESITKLCEN